VILITLNLSWNYLAFVPYGIDTFCYISCSITFFECSTEWIDRRQTVANTIIEADASRVVYIITFFNVLVIVSLNKKMTAFKKCIACLLLTYCILSQIYTLSYHISTGQTASLPHQQNVTVTDQIMAPTKINERTMFIFTF